MGRASIKITVHVTTETKETVRPCLSNPRILQKYTDFENHMQESMHCSSIHNAQRLK